MIANLLVCQIALQSLRHSTTSIGLVRQEVHEGIFEEEANASPVEDNVNAISNISWKMLQRDLFCLHVCSELDGITLYL